MPLRHPNLEQPVEYIKDGICFASLDLLQGIWQMAVGEESEETFKIVSQARLVPVQRVPRGVLNATPRF